MIFFVILFCFLQIVSTQDCNPSPTNSEPAHATAVMGNVCIRPIASAGDKIGMRNDGSPFLLTGVVDGISAQNHPTDSKLFIVYVNHELGPNLGVLRSHGAAGAFVTRLTIDKQTLRVISAGDLVDGIGKVKSSVEGWIAQPPSFERLCSADPPAVTALYNSKTGLGATERFHMAGEEEDDGRAFCFVVTGPNTGVAYSLPYLGRMRFENIVLNPYEQDMTIAAMSDDRFPLGIVAIYIGKKQASGNEPMRAGLVGGDLYGISVAGLEGKEETITTPLSGRFSLVKLRASGDQPITMLDNLQLQSLYSIRGGTLFRRPEDIAWHPAAPRRLILAQTDADQSRIYRLEFDSIESPTDGGTIVSLLKDTIDTNSDQYVKAMDNIAVDTQGNILVCEDGGDQAPNRLILIAGGGGAADPTNAANANQTPPSYKVETVAIHNPSLFGNSTTLPATGYTGDAEFSGVLDVSHILGSGYYLVANQAHNAPVTAPECIEKGQLFAIKIDRLASAPLLPQKTFPATTPTRPTTSNRNQSPTTKFGATTKSSAKGAVSASTGVPWYAIVIPLAIILVCIVGVFLFLRRRASETDSDYDEERTPSGRMDDSSSSNASNMKQRSHTDTHGSKDKPSSQRSLLHSASDTSADSARDDVAQQQPIAKLSNAVNHQSDPPRKATTTADPYVLSVTPIETKKTEPVESESSRARRSKKDRKSERTTSATTQPAATAPDTTGEVRSAAKKVATAAAMIVKSDGNRALFVPAARDVGAAAKELLATVGALNNPKMLEDATAVRQAVVTLVKIGKSKMENEPEATSQTLRESGAAVGVAVKTLLSRL